MRPAKEEVMAFLKPTAITKEELAGLEKLAPGDYEIYSERINMILAECKDVFTRRRQRRHARLPRELPDRQRRLGRRLDPLGRPGVVLQLRPHVGPPLRPGRGDHLHHPGHPDRLPGRSVPDLHVGRHLQRVAPVERHLDGRTHVSGASALLYGLGPSLFPGWAGMTPVQRMSAVRQRPRP